MTDWGESCSDEAHYKDASLISCLECNKENLKVPFDTLIIIVVSKSKLKMAFESSRNNLKS